MNEKYLLLQYNNRVSYTDDKCFVNGNDAQSEADQKSPFEKALYFKKKILYEEFLKRHFKNIVVLSAAGTSIDNGEKKGKTMDQLWTHCQKQIDAIKVHIPNLEESSFYKNKDLEGLLSYIILYEKINDPIRDDEKLLREDIENKIIEACTLELSREAPHVDFLNKITSRKPSDPRIQIFTTNYDLLFEHASNEAGFIVVDGFSFTHPRRFSGRYFDIDLVNREKTRLKQEESFVSKVFHLYKLHGSLNWSKEGTNVEQKNQPKKPLLIYPASEKYETSYDQPFFEMMSRFQQALRKENTLLIVIGFGFKDKHVQNAIIEAVEQNPSFQLLIVNYNGENDGIKTESIEPFFSNKDSWEVKRNVNIVFDSFKDFTKNYPTNLTYAEFQPEKQ
jgi:hypothetical protein